MRETIRNAIRGARARPGEALVLAGLWVALAVTPAIFAAPLYDDFTLPKQASLFVAAGLVLAGLSFAGEMMPRDPWLRRVVTAWFAWTTICFLLGIDRRGGLLGLYQYRQGFLTQSAYFVLFLGALTIGRSRGLKVVLVPGLLGMAAVTAYTAIQAAGVDPVHWWLDTSDRAIGTIGNANELAAYATIALTFAGAAGGVRTRWARAVPIIVAASAWFVVLEGKSRSGLVALVVAQIAIALAGFALRVGRGQVAKTFALLAAGAFIGIILSAWAGSAQSTTKRVRSGIESGDAGGSTRVSLVRGTIPAVTASPLWGYGPDGLYLAFPQHRPADLEGAFETYDLVVQSSHNWLLDAAANTGIPGLALLLGLLGRVAWGSLRRERGSGEEAVALVWGGMVAYCAITMFNPLSLAPHAAFFVLLGTLAARTEPSQIRAVPRGVLITARLRALLVAPTVAALFVVAILMLIADVAAQRGWEAYESNDFDRASREYGHAAKLLPMERNYASRGANALLTVAAVNSPARLREAEEALLRFDAEFGFGASESRLHVTALIGLRRPERTILAAIDRTLRLNPHGYAEAAYAEILREAAARGDGKLAYDEIDNWVYVDRLPYPR